MAVFDSVLWGGSAFAGVGQGESVFGRDVLHSIRYIVCEFCVGGVDECVGEDVGKVGRKKFGEEGRK